MSSTTNKPEKEPIRNRAGLALPDFVLNPSKEWLSRHTLASGDSVPQEQVLKLSVQATDAMNAATVVMLDDPINQNKALVFLQNALRKLKGEKVTQEDFRDAEQRIRLAAVLIERERKSQENARKYTLLVGLITLVQIGLILAYMYYVSGPDDRLLNGFAVPKAVITYAAWGSLSGVLFRFYTVPERRFVQEIRRLIARPILGVILGVATYLAFTNGLLVISNLTLNTSPNGFLQASSFLYLIAFLGGFSERWTNALINSLLSKLGKSNKIDSNTSHADANQQ